MTESITADLLAALDIAVLEPVEGNRFRVVGAAPAWLAEIWPEAHESAADFQPQTRSPFLENFLIDAARHWEHHDVEAHRSGVWIESCDAGTEWCLEATACTVRGGPLLVIENTRTYYQESVNVLQRARENALHFQQLVREVEKKDVLLHCIVHDLRSPLVSVKSLLTLLTEEPLAPRTLDLVRAGTTQLERQDLLIRTILDLFSADLSSVRGPERESLDVVATARAVVETFAPLCELQNVALSLEVDAADNGYDVFAERLRLFRVFANLVENALRYSKANDSVTIRLVRDGDEVVATVDDEGPGVDPALSERLFDRFHQGGGRPGNAGLGLHFCRITVEGWGGTIGQRNRAEGGSQFWFRLPNRSAGDGAA